MCRIYQIERKNKGAQKNETDRQISDIIPPKWDGESQRLKENGTCLHVIFRLLSLNTRSSENIGRKEAEKNTDFSCITGGFSGSQQEK